LTIVLDDAEAASADAPTSATPADTAAAFEAAVSLAASLAVQLLRRGYHVGLSAGGVHLPPAGGPGAAGHMLETLALVQPGTARALPAATLRGLTRMHVRPGSTGPQVDMINPGTGNPGAGKAGAGPVGGGRARSKSA
jgi:uncharacterized protein (DUF58 family)